MYNDRKELYLALSKKISQKEIPDEVIEKTVEKLAISKEKILRIDVCTYGICLDYKLFGDTPSIYERIGNIFLEDIVCRDINIFPFGIPFPNILDIKVVYHVPEIERAYFAQCSKSS